MVRSATENDIPAVMVMGVEFFNAAGWPECAEWDDESVLQTLSGLVSGALPGGLLVAEDADGSLIGMLGYMVFPFYFNFSLKVAQEIFWWVRPEARFGAGVKLLDAFESDAEKVGAKVFIVSSVARLRNEALTRFYARRGYKPAENTFIKRS